MTKLTKITKATSMELSTTPVLSDLELLKQELSGLAKISESNYIVDNCKIDGFTNTVQNETKIDARRHPELHVCWKEVLMRLVVWMKNI